MKTLHKTTVDGFEVEIVKMSDENDPARGEWVDAYVSKGRHSASLAVIEDFGYIEVDGGEDIKLAASTIDEIREIADAHGYDG
jgi:hypothetical protein